MVNIAQPYTQKIAPTSALLMTIRSITPIAHYSMDNKQSLNGTGLTIIPPSVVNLAKH